jgi:hypothetical protein
MGVGERACRRRSCLKSTTIDESTLFTRRNIMAKGIQGGKEAKKPKKDKSPPKLPTGTDEPVRATIVTSIMPKGKEKNKLK